MERGEVETVEAEGGQGEFGWAYVEVDNVTGVSWHSACLSL